MMQDNEATTQVYCEVCESFQVSLQHTRGATKAPAFTAPASPPVLLPVFTERERERERECNRIHEYNQS
jgi:hypothetical protein